MTNSDALVFGGAMLIDSDDVAPESFSIGIAAPVQLKPLRKFRAEALRSGLLRLPAAWTSGVPLRTHTTVQFMVRQGRIELGSRTLAANAFVIVPAGGVMPVISALEPSELLIIIDEGQAFVATPITTDDGRGDAIVIDDIYALPPIIPVIDGRPLVGFERRILWIDKATGADTRLLRIPAGFRGPGPNWHPVNEEIFCLDGEIAPAEDRSMKPGSFLWNPARCVHGYHEVTHSGCTLLEWHDGPWDLVKYRQQSP